MVLAHPGFAAQSGIALLLFALQLVLMCGSGADEPEEKPKGLLNVPGRQRASGRMAMVRAMDLCIVRGLFGCR